MFHVIGRTCPELAPDGTEYRSKVIEYMKRHFADVLGQDIFLLDIPGGLDVLQNLIRRKIDELRGRTPDVQPDVAST